MHTTNGCLTVQHRARSAPKRSWETYGPASRAMAAGCALFLLGCSDVTGTRSEQRSRDLRPESASGDAGVTAVVATVEELYAAVNNPGNTGATIKLLAAGSPYILTPRDALGRSRPNGGSLFLQPGMALVGENVYVDSDGDRVPDPRDDNGDGVTDVDQEGREVFAAPLTETIIDGRQLNIVAGGIVAGTIVVVGPVSVWISNVTVRGSPQAQAEIEIRILGNGVSSVTVTECTLERARRGILLEGSIRWFSDNGSANLRAERNVIREHVVPGVIFGWGIQSQQASASGIEYSLHLRQNRFLRNKVGLFVASLGALDGTTTVVSHSNIYEESVLTHDPTFVHVFSGGIVFEVRDLAPQRGSYRNRIHLISTDDGIWNNEGFAGVYGAGLPRAANGTEIMSNRIDIQLLRTRFVKRNESGTLVGLQNRESRVDPGKTEEEQPMLRRDIMIVGARSGPNLREPSSGELTGPASDNAVTVKVVHATSSLMPTAYDPAPQPFVVIDNAPNQVRVKLVLNHINWF